MQRHRRVRLLFPLTALLPLVAPAAEAQLIQGIVVEAEADPPEAGAGMPAPVIGADVELLTGAEGVGPRVVTDSLGRFSLPVPGAGTYGLRISHPAYVTYEADRVQVGSDETVSVQVRLGRNVIPLEPLVITARMRADMTGFQRRSTAGGFGSYLTREEIEARAAGRVTELLRGMPGVTIKFERWGVGPTIQMRSGLGTCEPAIFLDGVLAPEYRGSKLDDYLTPDRIEAVEVYSSFSTAPVQYISGTCGVILFWTRRGGREDGEPWHWKRVLIGLGVAVGLILWIK